MIAALRRPHVLLPQVLVKGALKREAFATDLTVEGLVVRVATDVVLQLVFSCVLLAAEFTYEWSDSHVQAHVAIQAPFLIEGLSTVDANESLIVGVPLAPQAALPHVVLQPRGAPGCLAVLRAWFDVTQHPCWDGQGALRPGSPTSVATEYGAGRTGVAKVDEAWGGQP